MKVLVCIPAYDGKLCVETVNALLNERLAAFHLPMELDVEFLPRTSLITQARNQLAQAFLDGEWDRMVFLDADVAFGVGDLIRLAHRPVDFVAGAYRMKKDPETYPVKSLPAGYSRDPAHGLVEVEAVPAGFLCLSRRVFATLRQAHPRRAYENQGRHFQGFFHAPIEDGVIWGEDNAFCADWRRAGGRVWIDPEPTLHHIDGGRAYSGNFGVWLDAQRTAECPPTRPFATPRPRPSRRQTLRRSTASASSSAPAAP